MSHFKVLVDFFIQSRVKVIGISLANDIWQLAEKN
jgi:hypothetical protein